MVRSLQCEIFIFKVFLCYLNMHEWGCVTNNTEVMQLMNSCIELFYAYVKL